MAMKPVGKAIVIGLVALCIAGGVYYSGALDKLKSKPTEAAADASTPAAWTAPATPAPAPQPEAQAPAAPPQPSYGGTRQDAALDSLLQGNKK